MMIVSTCMIVPVYMHNWQGCCVMIQPIQLHWTNRCLLLVLCTAASSSGSPPNVSHSLVYIVLYGANSGQKIDTTVGRSPNDRPTSFCNRPIDHFTGRAIGRSTDPFLRSTTSLDERLTDRPMRFCVRRMLSSEFLTDRRIGLGGLCSIFSPLCYSLMLEIVPIMPKIMPEFAHYAPTMPTAQYYGRSANI